jgi:hypothetical protein
MITRLSDALAVVSNVACKRHASRLGMRKEEVSTQENKTQFRPTHEEVLNRWTSEKSGCGQEHLELAPPG